MGRVHVDGLGQTKFGEDGRRLEAIFADAGQKALDDSICKDPPDMIIIGNYNYQGYMGQASLDTLVGTELRIPSTTPIRRVERGSSTGALAVEVGAEHVGDGKKVLVIAGEGMWKKGYDRATVTQETSKVIDESERKLGLTMPRIMAIATDEYMARYGISEKQMREIFFQRLNENRWYGSLNDYAFFKDQLSRYDYLNNPDRNPMTAKPLTRNDCAGVFNGAAAVYLVPHETDIKLSGIKSAFSRIKINRRKTLTSMDATVDAARAVFEAVDLNPHEIDIVELHDAFASVPIIAAEDIGLVERGKGSEFVLYGKNKNGKDVFYNLSGGFLSKTHPIAASGTAQLVELVSQMRGLDQYSEMLKEHKEDINYGLWLSINGFGFYNSVGIVEKTGSSVREREGLDEENLPTRFEPDDNFFQRYRKRRLYGAVNLSSDEENPHYIGLVMSNRGRLHLAYYRGEEDFKLGGPVDIVRKKDGLYFVPVSSRVSRMLEKILS